MMKRSRCLAWALSGALLASSVAISQTKVRAKSESVVYSGTYWKSVKEVYKSGNRDEIDTFTSAADAYEKSGECVDVQFEVSDEEQEERDKKTLDAAFRNSNQIISGRVVAGEGGLRDSHIPATMLEISVEDRLKGEMVEENIFYQLNAFDGFLPDGRYVCYKQESVRVPKPGETVTLFFQTAEIAGKLRHGRIRESVASPGWIPATGELMIISTDKGFETDHIYQRKLDQAYSGSAARQQTPRSWLIARIAAANAEAQ